MKPIEYPEPGGAGAERGRGRVREMIVLRAERLHWVADDGRDDPTDLCAHSPVTCEIDGEVIVSPADGDWTVSAAAIFLLRALDRDHTKDSPVGGHIFPCCGNVIHDAVEPEVVICGCPSGIDFEICRSSGAYEIRLDDGRRILVAEERWREAVVRFSDEMRAFYAGSQVKKPVDKDGRKGFKAMMGEWERLRARCAGGWGRRCREEGR
ncbi:hypothetical protein OKA05_29010 [Luteolibacter arcticus]|uniref:Uncharacterized protein n=1 Tax=Luteolibacter arcticus TaxID=1581411 RepID=A0ABT3GT25_9BACT|nr:hypothetical protein [Luteolibacter arcticus]MCW1926628.1 hypothetical protein [Luteolibacter arcticus]